MSSRTGKPRHSADSADPAKAAASSVWSQDVRVPNALGMHARPAAGFVRLAGGFRCSIQVKKDDLVVNGKSIMGVLMLAAEQGSVLTIRAEGEGSRRAVETLAALVGRGFDE